jgi:hypothetical protein
VAKHAFCPSATGCPLTEQSRREEHSWPLSMNHHVNMKSFSSTGESVALMAVNQALTKTHFINKDILLFGCENWEKREVPKRRDSRCLNKQSNDTPAVMPAWLGGQSTARGKNAEHHRRH